ncbi:MAG: LytR C-terminal domain-containing protein [Acidimicrobiales bacterium]
MTRQGPEPTAPYDTGEWVDVGRDGLWHPSGGERARAMLILAVFVGSLLFLAGVASVGGKDDDADVAARSTTSTEPQVVTTTSIVPTTELDPASLDGVPPPGVCEPDIGREGAAMRDRSDVVVLVLNGTSRSGHAGAFTDDVDDLGYGTIVPANAGRLSVTTIEYVPSYCAEAVRLLFELGVDGAEVQPLDPDTDVFLGRAALLVTLGMDSL